VPFVLAFALAFLLSFLLLVRTHAPPTDSHSKIPSQKCRASMGRIIALTFSENLTSTKRFNKHRIFAIVQYQYH
jgi:hypothetical protein